jgi:hypothetical protein
VASSKEKPGWLRRCCHCSSCWGTSASQAAPAHWCRRCGGCTAPAGAAPPPSWWVGRWFRSGWMGGVVLGSG